MNEEYKENNLIDNNEIKEDLQENIPTDEQLREEGFRNLSEPEEKAVRFGIEDLVDENSFGALSGILDENIRIVEDETGASIFQRGTDFTIKGEHAEVAKGAIIDMAQLIASGEALDRQKLEYIITLNKQGKSYKDADLSREVVCYTHFGRPLKPKTVGQKDYVNSIRNKDIVFGIGPAGTGKTYLAVALAVTAYKRKEVQKIILTRPAVEAGERLGFLPGDLQDKVDPYLRPLYDALNDILGRDAAMRLREKEDIEIVPLAYMRGRTLDNAFIILDEAQNTTREQMKMFLTRMGFGSKVVVTGDVTQIDLPGDTKSGLTDAIRVLKNIRDIDFCYLTDADVVRHQLVRKIIKAYDDFYNHTRKRD